MGSYLKQPPPSEPKQTLQAIPRINELQEALFQTVQEIYGAGVTRDSVFVAKHGNMVFDYADCPKSLDQKKLISALTNNNNIEVIYFVPDSFAYSHRLLSYRFVGDYVNVLSGRNRSDLVRTINEHRNRIEESYERSRKARASQNEAQRPR